MWTIVALSVSAALTIMDPLYVTLVTAKSSRRCIILENITIMDLKSDWHGSEAGVSFRVETLETRMWLKSGSQQDKAGAFPLDAVASTQILNQPAQVVWSVLCGNQLDFFYVHDEISPVTQKGLFGSVLQNWMRGETSARMWMRLLT